MDKNVQHLVDTILDYMDDETLFMLDALFPSDRHTLMKKITSHIQDSSTTIETYQQIVDIIKDYLNKI